LGHFRRVLPRIMAIRQAGIEPAVLIRHFKVPPPILVLKSLQQWFRSAAEQGRISCPNPHATALTFLGGLQIRAMFDILIGPFVEKGVIAGSDEEHVQSLVATLWLGIQPNVEKP